METLGSWLATLTVYAVTLIDFVALVVIVGATLQAIFGMVRAMAKSSLAHERRAVWMRSARWLIAGITFQLAADILETAITTDWEAIARVAAIAVIRTFLNYFLEKDFREVRAEAPEK